jgi:mRNA interferase MazF
MGYDLNVMEIKQGDIIFIPYPFTDLSGVKKRPVVVISKSSRNENIIVAKITSVIRNDKNSFDLTTATINNLPKKSEVRTNELFTVSKQIVIKKLTALNNSSLNILVDEICKNFK